MAKVKQEDSPEVEKKIEKTLVDHLVDIGFSKKVAQTRCKLLKEAVAKELMKVAKSDKPRLYGKFNAAVVCANKAIAGKEIKGK